MLKEWEKKYEALRELAESFQRLRSFATELRRTTRGKRFEIKNALAWDALFSLRRMLVIDLSGWVDSIQDAWLKRNLQGPTLSGLRASKRLAEKLAASRTRPNVPREDARWIHEHHVREILSSRRKALEWLFGKSAAKRGHATEADVFRLSKRIEKWSKNLDAWRNEHAHRYGFESASVKSLRLADVAKRFTFCVRLMNNLRLLVDDSTHAAPDLDPSENDKESRDVLDLVVLGHTDLAIERIEKMPGPYHWQRRDAYYAELHKRRRKTKTASFNV